MSERALPGRRSHYGVCGCYDCGIRGDKRAVKRSEARAARREIEAALTEMEHHAPLP